METEREKKDGVMRRYAAGDVEAFNELYRLLEPLVRRLCARLARGSDEADDLVQDTFLRLHRARAAYLPGTLIDPWLSTMARTAHLDRLRRGRKQRALLWSEELPVEITQAPFERPRAPDDTACVSALWRAVAAALEHVSPSNRAAFELVRQEGLSVAAAAARLATTEIVVRQRVHRAAEQVRAALSAAGWEHRQPRAPIVRARNECHAEPRAA